jgi:hypothetical protein
MPALVVSVNVIPENPRNGTSDFKALADITDNENVT